MKKIYSFFFIFVFSTLISQTPGFNWVSGLTGGFGKACWLKTDNQGNIYIAGNFGGTIDFDPSANTATIQAFGNNDVYFAKYDMNGNYIWAKKIGGPGVESANCLTLDNNGNIFLIGNCDNDTDFDPSASTATFAPGGQDLYFAKYDNNGNYLWAKTLVGSNSLSGNGIVHDSNGNIFITGNKSGQTDFDPSANTVYLNNIGNTDAYLAKYDNSGTYQWAINLGSTLNDYSYGIVCDANNDVTITGEFRNLINFDPLGASPTGTLLSKGQGDAFIAKYATNGNLIWAKNIGGSSTDNSRAISLDNSNNILICGEYRTGCDFDPAATTFSLTENANGGAYIAKYDQNGAYIWAKGFTGPNSETGLTVATDANGNVYTSGTFYGDTDFDPTASTNTLTTYGSGDYYIAGLSSSGNMLFASSFGGTNGDACNAITISGNNLIGLGDFSQTVDFDPGPGTATLTTFSLSGAFIQNLNIGNLISEVNENNSDNLIFALFPNPATEQITIRHSLPSDADLILTDQSGRNIAVYSSIASNTKIKIDLPAGFYFCSLSANGVTLKTTKLIIQ